MWGACLGRRIIVKKIEKKIMKKNTVQLDV